MKLTDEEILDLLSETWEANLNLFSLHFAGMEQERLRGLGRQFTARLRELVESLESDLNAMVPYNEN